MYDASTGTYTLTGSGDNIWWAEDDFHYVWKKVSGDFSLSADIALLGTGGEPHRKAVSMIRQTLDQDSAAVALAVHGDGLTSLQWRLTRGDNMHEVQANVKAPTTVRVEKHGDYFSAFVTGADGKVGPSGAATKVVFTGPNGRRPADHVVTIELQALAGATLPLVDPTYKVDGVVKSVTDFKPDPPAIGSPPTGSFPYLGRCCARIRLRLRRRPRNSSSC